MKFLALLFFSGYNSQLRLEGTRKRRASQQLYRGELQLHSLPHLISMKYTVCVGNRKRRGSIFRNQNSKTRLEHENHPNKQETIHIYRFSIPSAEKFILFLTRWFVATCIRIWLEAAPADGSATCQSHLYQRDISCIGGADMVLNVPSLLSISTLCCVWRWIAMPL